MSHDCAYALYTMARVYHPEVAHTMLVDDVTRACRDLPRYDQAKVDEIGRLRDDNSPAANALVQRLAWSALPARYVVRHYNLRLWRGLLGSPDLRGGLEWVARPVLPLFKWYITRSG